MAAVALVTAEVAAAAVEDSAEAEEASAGAEVVAEEAASGAVDEEEEEEEEVMDRALPGLGARVGREPPWGFALTVSLPCRWRVPVWWQPGSWSGRKERKPIGEECDGRAPST